MKLNKAIELFLSNLKQENRSERSISSYGYDLNPLLSFAESEMIKSIEKLKEIIGSYGLYIYRKKNKQSGEVLSIGSQCRILSTARSFFNFLYERNYLSENHASSIRLPKQNKSLPRGILSMLEIDHLLSLPNLNTIIGLRDQAILETLYGTGIRASELCFLHIQDLDLNRQEILVLGKGKRERLLPLHDRLIIALLAYLDEARPVLLKKAKHLSGKLFLNTYGHPLQRRQVANIVKKYSKELKRDDIITSHNLRHSVATHLLQNGADIRFIQQFLGHNSIESTQIYTRVSIGDLRNVIEDFHPLSKDQ